LTSAFVVELMPPRTGYRPGGIRVGNAEGFTASFGFHSGTVDLFKDDAHVGEISIGEPDYENDVLWFDNDVFWFHSGDPLPLRIEPGMEVRQ
jgi:hypothetical protein